MWKRYLLGLILGILGSVAAVYLHFPIPWLLGSLFLFAIATWHGLPISPPPNYIERWMRVAIGVSLGPAVASSLQQSGNDLPFAIAAAVLITSISVVGGVRWFEIKTGLPRASAFLTALPGGLSMLLAMAGNVDNRAQVFLAHTVRVVIVVVFISLLARLLGVPPEADPLIASVQWSNGTSPIILGALIVGCFFLAERVHLAGGHVIIPMFITTVLAAFTDVPLDSPQIIKTVALLVFGMVLGAEVASGPRDSYSRLAVTSAIFTVAIMMVGAALALLMTQFIDQSFLVLFLALAPGGIAEVSLVALALGLDAGLVALVHSCRFLFIILAGPVGLRYFTRNIK